MKFIELPVIYHIQWKNRTKESLLVEYLGDPDDVQEYLYMDTKNFDIRLSLISIDNIKYITPSPNPNVSNLLLVGEHETLLINLDITHLKEILKEREE